jgi:hypothetical protein
MIAASGSEAAAFHARASGGWVEAITILVLAVWVLQTSAGDFADTH